MEPTAFKALRENLSNNIEKQAIECREAKTRLAEAIAHEAEARKKLTVSVTELRNFDNVFAANCIAEGETLPMPSLDDLLEEPPQQTQGASAPKAATKPGRRADTVKVTEKASKASKPKQASADGKVKLTFPEKILAVMGSNIMRREEVYEGLKERGWLPDATDPVVYIGHVLSKLPDRFARIEGRRGYYANAALSGSKRGSKSGSKRSGSKRAEESGSKRSGSVRADTSGSKRSGSKRSGSKRSNGESIDPMLAEAGVRRPTRRNQATV